MKKIKVLIVAGAMNVGGIENQLMHLLRKADKTEFQIDFTSTANGKAYYEDEIIELGSKCVHIPKTERKHFLRYCRALYKVIKEGEYDIVHSHELFHSGMVLLTARAAGVKHRFVHAHNWMEGNDPYKKKKLHRRVYNYVMRKLIRWNATEYIACSTLAGKFLFGESIVNKPNYHLIFNSVDTSKFIDHFDDLEEGDFCDEEWVNVIQVGRFTPVKNQMFTAEIAKELKRRNEKIRILCAGNSGGQYETEVKNKILEYGIEHHMYLLGIRKDIDSLMRKSSAFLLPSLYEGMPLVLIEAQASGLPCVVSSTFSREVDFQLGGIQWMHLEDGVNSWCDAIEKAVDMPRFELNKIQAVIKKYGFDSSDFGERICILYKNSVKE